jgi:hypothetical protein
MTCSMSNSRICRSLAQLTNIQTSTESNGTVDVSIDGQSLVSGDKLMDTLQTYDASGNGSGQLLLQTVIRRREFDPDGRHHAGNHQCARDGELATMQNSINTLASTLSSLRSTR